MWSNIIIVFYFLRSSTPYCTVKKICKRFDSSIKLPIFLKLMKNMCGLYSTAVSIAKILPLDIREIDHAVRKVYTVAKCTGTVLYINGTCSKKMH